MDLVASMIEEADFTGSLNESLHQIASRIRREQFSPASRAVLDKGLDHLDQRLSLLESDPAAVDPSPEAMVPMPPSSRPCDGG